MSRSRHHARYHHVCILLFLGWGEPLINGGMMMIVGRNMIMLVVCKACVASELFN